MDRINRLCSYLDECKVFADVACDHGYCTRYMLENNLCVSAVISDISAKSLSKAQKLLSEYIDKGVCRAVCCDGLEKVSGADEVLIAGIGGEEILNILQSSYIPEKFVFQPMKNTKHLREFLLKNGCKLTCDDVFSDGRNYYFIIKGTRRGGALDYTPAELEYGKDSLKNSVFKRYLEEELAKKRGYLKRGLSDGARAEILSTIKFMEEALFEVNGNI